MHELCVPHGIVLSSSHNSIAGVELDEASAAELTWLLDHFIVLEHWKISEADRELAFALRDALEKDIPLTHQQAMDAQAIVNKVFDISDEAPRANLRWKENDFLELSGVLEDICSFTR